MAYKYIFKHKTPQTENEHANAILSQPNGMESTNSDSNPKESHNKWHIYHVFNAYMQPIFVVCSGLDWQVVADYTMTTNASNGLYAA